MRFPDGEIITTPKIIYWIGPPPHLTRDDIVDVLKDDLLIIPCDPRFTSFHYLKKSAHQRTVYFFNLDYIIKENSIKQKHMKAFAGHLSDFLTLLTPAKSLIYSQGNKEIFDPVFTSLDIPFQKNPFLENCNLVDSIHNVTDVLFMKHDDNKKAIRAAYRMFLLPLKYTVKASIRTGKHIKTLNGYIKDISLNGVGFILKNPDGIGDVQQDARVTLQLSLHTTIIHINSSIVSRCDPDKAEIGVRYDINDNKMISEDHGDILSSLMYTWLRQVVHRYDTTIYY